MTTAVVPNNAHQQPCIAHALYSMYITIHVHVEYVVNKCMYTCIVLRPLFIVAESQCQFKKFFIFTPTHLAAGDKALESVTKKTELALSMS